MHIVSFHTLNVRSMIKSSVYMLLVFIGCVMCLDGVVDICNSPLDAASELFDLIKEDHFWLGLCLIVVVFIMNQVLMFHFILFALSYFTSMIYAQRMFYLYWRLDRYVKYFGRIWGGYYQDTEVSRVDVLKYFNMLAIYLLIKESYNRNGMKGELYKKYRGIELTHAIDKAARVRIREWAMIFGNSTPEIKKYFASTYIVLVSNNNCRFAFRHTGDFTIATRGMELMDLKDVKSIIRNIYFESNDKREEIREDISEDIANSITSYILNSYQEDIYANII